MIHRTNKINLYRFIILFQPKKNHEQRELIEQNNIEYLNLSQYDKSKKVFWLNNYDDFYAFLFLGLHERAHKCDICHLKFDCIFILINDIFIILGLNALILTETDTYGARKRNISVYEIERMETMMISMRSKADKWKIKHEK